MQSRIKDRLDDANRLAIKRSGLRGREARKELVKMEKEYSDFCKQNPQKYVTADMVNEVIAQVFERVELVDQEECKNRAQKLLKGLGFSEAQSVSLISTFSGGWRMRIALAKSLFMKPDILLLDEPTNHLDLPAILWLQEYIINDTNDMIVVVVSHDREFLNNVTEETIILKDKQLKYHPGNYQDWEANTEEQRIRKQTMLDVSFLVLLCYENMLIINQILFNRILKRSVKRFRPVLNITFNKLNQQEMINDMVWSNQDKRNWIDWVWKRLKMVNDSSKVIELVFT